jgi:hypothetical protein
LLLLLLLLFFSSAFFALLARERVNTGDFRMQKPLILLVCTDVGTLKVLAEWVRSHGCDVCACLDSEIPPVRCWPDRFIGAVLAHRGLVQAVPIDAFYLDSGFDARLGKRMIESWLERNAKGGVGVIIRPGRTRPVWGSCRLVRGCGRALIRDEAIRDDQGWVA